MTHDEAAAIHQRLDRLDQKLDKIVEAVTTQVAICSPTRAKLAALCETVYGNGQVGLLRKVERLETVAVIRGKGSPEGQISSPPGVIYVPMDPKMGDAIYIKLSGQGNRGWVNILTGYSGGVWAWASALYTPIGGS